MRHASPAALARVVRSLVSWWEIPPRSSLERGDAVRFAHAIATLARQLVMAASGLNDLPFSWYGPWRVAPAEFLSRLGEMTSLADRERSADLAESLLEDMLTLAARHGVEEAERRFLKLRSSARAPMSFAQAEALALSLFDRARQSGARAVLIADSYARGCADAASDVDIRLVVEAVPTLAERHALVRPFAEDGQVRQYGDEAYITSDQFLRHGQRVDVKYHPVAWLERALHEPFVLGGPIDLLELVEVHVVVADPMGVFARVKSGAGERAVRAREVAAVSLNALRERAFADSAAAPLEAMATALGLGLEYAVRAWAGLNGRIHAFPKWMHLLVPTFALRPPDAWEWLLALATAPWTRETISLRLGEWRRFVEDLAGLERRMLVVQG